MLEIGFFKNAKGNHKCNHASADLQWKREMKLQTNLVNSNKKESPVKIPHTCIGTCIEIAGWNAISTNWFVVETENEWALDNNYANDWNINLRTDTVTHYNTLQ